MLNVGVLIGGRSVEHSVAVITAMQMIENMDREKYNIIPIYINNEGKWLIGEGLDKFETYKAGKFENTREVFFNPSFKDRTLYSLKDVEVSKGMFSGKEKIKTLEEISKIDVMVLGLHGTNAEDGSIQGFLDTLGIAYTGSDIMASAVGMDKVIMKDLYKANDIPVVNYVWFYRDSYKNNYDEVMNKISTLRYPLIVKPSNLGSSIGINKATNEEKLIEAINIAIEYDEKIIVEEAIENLREINCAVIGRNDEIIASILEEPIGWKDIQSFENKYSKSSGTTRRIPADVPKDIEEEIKRLSKKSFEVLNCQGTARVDILLEDNEKIYVNEINTLPGSTSYHLWDKTNINFKELMDKLIEIALKDREEKDKNMVTFDSDIYDKTSYGTKSAITK